MRRFIVFTIFVLTLDSLLALPVNKQRKFENYFSAMQQINAFFQDKKGQIWCSTTDGLLLFDGQSFVKQTSFTSKGLDAFTVYCLIQQSDSLFLLGTSNGLVIFDAVHNHYKQINFTERFDIRSLCSLADNTLLLGTMSGLFRINLTTETIIPFPETKNQIIHAIHALSEDKILVGGYQQLFMVKIERSQTYSIAQINLPNSQNGLVLSMMYDKNSDNILIGTEGSLLKMSVKSHKISSINKLNNNSIKAILVTQDNHWWLGSDNGLYIYNPADNSIEHLLHRFNFSQSLIDNVVWSIFQDKDNNIWLGTDSGISLYRHSPIFTTYYWNELAETGEGNRISSIFYDSFNNLWLGGSNGLCCYNFSNGQSRLFKMKESQDLIAHNHIRYCFEDRDRNFWMASDGGLSFYDRTNHRFIRFSICDSSQTRHIDWLYHITEDNEGFLWLTTYQHGVFKVNKKNLLTQKSSPYIADNNWHKGTSPENLSLSRIQNATLDKKGNLWVATTKDGVNQINRLTGKITRFNNSRGDVIIPSNEIFYILCDMNGKIWLGMNGQIVVLDPETYQIKSLSNPFFKNKSIISMTEEGERIWCATPQDIFYIEKKSQHIFPLLLEKGYFNSIYYDTEKHDIWVGGNDKCLVFNPTDAVNFNNDEHTPVLTSLYINEQPVIVGESYNSHTILKQSLLYTRQINLTHQQNNVSFVLSPSFYSDLPYQPYQYRLEGLDNQWRTINKLPVKLTFSNLNPGEYTLIIKQHNNLPAKKDYSYQLNILINNAWYWSITARTIYLILFVAFIIWVYNYFRIRYQMRIEKINRQKIEELTDLKIKFLTNVSHEFKTPLSLIISPVNQLIHEVKNHAVKQTLSLVHHNALQLNALLHRLLDFNNSSLPENSLTCCKLEIVEFCRGILGMYQDSYPQLNFHFHTETTTLYLYADIVKIESILNNLLSNACKFTPQNGSITLSVNQSDNDVVIIITDTGAGIPEKDIEHVFERFYQSDAHRQINHQGSGIGLSLVKQYVELHGGKITVESKENKGSTFKVIIPVKESSLAVMETKKISKERSSKYTVLIVEDNVDISNYIEQQLSDFHCIIAHNGKIAIEKALVENPDLIISDVMMPFVDGLTMSKILKENIHTATIPIILLTAKTDPKTEQEAYKIGVELFISKPFDIKLLQERMIAILQKQENLLSKIKQSVIIEKPINVEELTSENERFLDKITSIIEKNLDNDDLNVEHLSKISGISKKQIYRRIKQLTGKNTIEYITSIRMKKAALLLKQNKFTISEVMYMVGFSSHSYFAKCFSEHYQKTPTEYSKQPFDR